MISAKQLANELTDNTVLGEWFQPMDRALDKVRFSDRSFSSLPMSAFILFGCLRQVHAIPSMREMIQTLLHANEYATKPPVPRSTLSDAYASICRRDILAQALSHLIQHAQSVLPDKLVGVEGLGNRAVIATDATYQKESSHYRPIYPSQGGGDNKKGHQHLTHFDMRRGIPLTSLIETASIAEIRRLKERGARATQGCRYTSPIAHLLMRPIGIIKNLA